MPSARRNQGLGHPRRLGRYITALVIALQLVCIGAFLADPATLPWNLEPFEMLWAWFHKPSFYPLIVLIAVGFPLTLLSLRIRGPHRAAMILSWMIFATVVYLRFYDRVLLKLEILWKQYG